MNAPTIISNRQDQTRRLRRWTWALLALAFVLMLVFASLLDVESYILSDVTSNLLTTGLVLGILTYFICSRRTRLSQSACGLVRRVGDRVGHGADDFPHAARGVRSRNRESS